jgi:hypothetical protein
MAGFVVSPNTIRVLWHQSTHGRPQLIVTHGQYTTAGPLNPNIAETIWSQFKTLMGAGPMVNFATTFAFTGVGVIDLRSPNNPEISSTSAAFPGTATGPATPDQVSCVVTLRTALAGRSFRGRMFIFGWEAALLAADGLIPDVIANTAVATATNMQGAIAAAGAQLAIRSPALPERPSKPGGTLPAKAFAITPVSTILVRDRIWDTNRRRVDLLRR